MGHILATPTQCVRKYITTPAVWPYAICIHYVSSQPVVRRFPAAKIWCRQT